MSSSPKILVFGATGNIGREVCAELAKRNTPFRAAVHKIEKAESIKKLGQNIDVVEVDIYNPDSLEKALNGIEKVFFMSPPGQTSSYKSMSAACKKAGVKHAVKLSALGSEETGGKFVWAEEHCVAEKHLNSDGIAVTSIRPSAFFSNIYMDQKTIKNSSTFYKAMEQKRMNFIDNRDIGEAVAVCLTTNGHEGKIYNLTGPDTINFDDLAKIFSDKLGKEVKYVSVSDAQLRETVKAFLPSQEAIDGMSNMWTYFRNGGYDRSCDDGEKLLGRKLRDISTYIQENKLAFA